MAVTLVELAPYDPVLGAVVTVRVTSHNDALATALNGVPWWPALASAGKFGQRALDASFAGALAARASGLVLDLSAFPNAARYIWGDKPASVWTGALGAAFGGYTKIFAGLSGAASVADGRISVSLRVDDAWLSQPLLNAFYAGTGGIEGPASLKGTPKPLCLGAPQYVVPQLIDAVNNVYQFHGYGSARSVLAVLDRLVRYPASTGDYATYALLIAAAIPAGSFATCLASGLVRLGAPPAGVLSLLPEGDNGGADGWVRYPGAIMKRLAAIAGAAAKVDAASLAAFDAGVPRAMSEYYTAAVSVGEAIRSIAAQSNGAIGIGLLGKLIAVRGGGASALTLRTDGAALPIARTPRTLEISAPYWRMQLGAAPAWFVHGSGDYGLTGYADLTGRPAAVADINAAEGVKLTSVETNATLNPAGDNITRNDSFEIWLNATTPLAWASTGPGALAQLTGSGATRRGNTAAKFTGSNRIWGESFPVNVGEKLWLDAAMRTTTNATTGSTVGTAYWRLGIGWAPTPLGATGAAIVAATDLFLAAVPVAAGIVAPSGVVVVPSGAKYAALYGFLDDGNAGSNAVSEFDYFTISRTEPAATVGAANRRLLGQFFAGGAQQVYNTNPISAATSGGSSSISIAAHTVSDDVGAVSYSSGSISGLSPGTYYYVYQDDPNYTGGALTCSATTSYAALAAYGRRLVGVVTTPASAGSSTGGGAGAGGGGGGGPIP